MSTLNLRIGAMSCCGLGEISSLYQYRGDFNGALQGLLNAGLLINGRRLQRGAFVFTSAQRGDPKPNNYAAKFAQDIVDRDLGFVEQITKFRNPNTNNVIDMYVWVPTITSLKRYIKQNNLSAARRDLYCGGYY